jgi:hypothetical protein
VGCKYYKSNEDKCSVSNFKKLSERKNSRIDFDFCKNADNACAMKDAKIIGDLADACVMSHNAFAIRQALMDNESSLSLKKYDQELKAKVHEFYGIKNASIKFTPYIKLQCMDTHDIDDVKSRGPSEDFAGIFSWLREVKPSESYELRFKIYYVRKKPYSYDTNDVLKENCSRFLVGHELSHVVLNLGDLIKKAKKNKGSTEEIFGKTSIENDEADIFSHILSGLRDFQQIFPNQKFNFKDVKKILDNMPGVLKIKEKLKKEHGKSDSYCDDKISKILKQIEVLDCFSQNITMSHLISALEEYLEKSKNQKIDIYLDVDKNSTVSSLYLDCLTAYRYNIIENLEKEKIKSLEKPKEIRKFMCVAIACIYYGFSGIEKHLEIYKGHKYPKFRIAFLKADDKSKDALNIDNIKLWVKPVDEDNVPESIENVLNILNKGRSEKINKEKIELFSDMLIKLRKDSFEDKKKQLKEKHKKLVKRLENLKL